MVEKIGYPEMCVNKTLLGEYYQQARDKYVNVKITKVCFFLWRDKIFSSTDWLFIHNSLAPFLA